MIHVLRKSYILLKRRLRKTRSYLEKKKGLGSWIIGVLFYGAILFTIIQGLEIETPLAWKGMKILGVGCIVLVFFLVAFFYFYRFKREILLSPSRLFLICLFIWGTLFLGWGILSIPTISSYAIPVALTGMILASILGGESALICVIVLGGLLGLLTNFKLEIVFAAVLGGGVAALATAHTPRRIDLIKVGILVGLLNALFTSGWAWVNNWGYGHWTTEALWGIENGLVSAFLAIGILPLLENFFGIVTDSKLFELSHLTHPLLVLLQEKAPGTYQSSVMVANLAEIAAGKIGANSLLAKVGAYYHDIGKLKNPAYFTENKALNGKDKHKNITPILSSLILMSHVKEGIQLARKYRLPLVIQDIIRQHHGTTFASFFYQKALEEDSRKSLKEEDFRYLGPKPRNKETGIIMLADVVEAASRTLENPTPPRIKSLVEKVIKEKLLDGQLDECPITFNDLRIIRESFIYTLSSAFHTRVEYPAKDEETVESKSNQHPEVGKKI